MILTRPAVPVIKELQTGAPLYNFLIPEGPTLVNKPRLSHRLKNFAIAVVKSVMGRAGTEYSQYKLLAEEETFRSD